MLANIYLHYVLDLWMNEWRKLKAKGDIIMVRYADDFVVGFQHKKDAEEFLKDLESRFRKYSLEIHTEKTRLIEFGRFTQKNRQDKGQRKPEVLTFLGFTHFCTKTRKGCFRIGRKPIGKRVDRTLKRIRDILKRGINDDIWERGKWIGQVLNGWLNYYAVPGSMKYLQRFKHRLEWIWMKIIRRRSQRARKFSWEKLEAMVKILMPRITIRHPWPVERFAKRHNLK